MNKFPEMVRYLRLRDGLTQAELGAGLGVGETTISMWELGKRQPDHDMTENVADYFNVGLDFLMGREKNPATISDDGKNDPVRKKLIEFYNGFDETKRRLLLERAELLDRMQIDKEH